MTQMATVTGTQLLARAAMLSGLAHVGEVDEQGQPVLAHLRTVARRVRDAGGGTEAQAVALLHHALSRPNGAKLLETVGFSAEVIAAVESVQVRVGEPHTEFQARLAANPLAQFVWREGLHGECCPDHRQRA